MKNSIFLILMTALILRLWGMGYGLYHPDEPIVVNHALAFAGGDFNPHFFKIPPLASYLLFIVYGLFFLAGKMAGAFASVSDFERLFFTHPEVFYYVGRFFMGVVPGVLAVYALYRMSRLFFGQRTALFSALFLAVNFLHGRDSHFIYADIPMTLLVMLSAFFCVKIVRRGALRDYLGAAFFLGAACAFKYNAAVAAASFLAANRLGPNRSWRLLASAGLFSLAVYAILNPFSFLDFPFFAREFQAQAGAESTLGLWHHLRYSLVSACGTPMLLASFGGWIFLMRRHAREAAVMLAFMLAFYLSLAFVSQSHERYVLPLVPFVCLGAGFLADRSFEMRGKPAKALMAVFLAAALILPAAKLVFADHLYSQPDTRDRARDWIEKNISSGEKIAFSHSFQRPRLRRDPAQKLDFGDLSAAQSLKKEKERKYSKGRGPSYALFFLSENGGSLFSQDRPVIPPDAKALRENGIAYVTLDYQSRPEFPAFYEELKRSASRVAVFSPYRADSKLFSLDPFAVTAGPVSWKELFSRTSQGPRIEIYRLRNPS